MKMTAGQYLKARGWVYRDVDDGRPWIDPRHAGGLSEGDDSEVLSAGLDDADALTIQRARDAEAERAAWVAFAAAAMSAAAIIDSTEQSMSRADRRADVDDPMNADPSAAIADPIPGRVADLAEEILDEYRARFRVELTDAPEGT